MENKLWDQMASLTYTHCKKTCKCLGSCCSKEYCEEAERYSKENQIEGCDHAGNESSNAPIHS